MALEYLHLSPGDPPPAIDFRPYRAVLVADEAVSQDWQNEVCSRLLGSGCLYFIACGVACETWHDTMDWTVLESFDFSEIPDDRFVMTTWHDKEPLSEALWFAENAAHHPDVDLADTVIVHVASANGSAAILSLYADSQVMPDDV